MEKIRQSDEFFHHNNANMKSKEDDSENEEEENYDFSNDQTFENANGKNFVLFYVNPQTLAA